MSFKLNKKVIPVTVFLTSILIYFYNPLNNIDVKSFDRAIGKGIINGIDIGKRIDNFYFWILILTPILFIAVYKFVNIVYSKFNDEIAFEFINCVSYCSILPVAIMYINKFTNTVTELDWGVQILFTIVISVLLFLCLKRYICIPFETFKCCIFISISAIFPMYILLKSYISDFSILICIALLISVLISVKFKQNLKRFQLSSIPIAYGGLAISICIESVNILNQHNIFINNIYIMIFAIYLILISVCVFLYLKVFCNTERISKFKYDSLYCTAILISVSSIMVQPQLQSILRLEDMFETANHGLAIYEFFEYGKIPILETFDAHMFQNSIWGIVYNILNMDLYGAMFVTYGVYIIPIRILILYKILELCFDSDFAFFISIVFPVSLPIFWSDFALISILTILYAMKKNNIVGYILYWISIAAICMYRLDTGFAFTVSTILVFFTMYFLNKKSLNLKYFVLSFISVIAVSASFYFVICMIKNINPIERIFEFVSIAMSNTNWAYESIGDTDKLVFSIAYIFVPFSAIVCVFTIFINLKSIGYMKSSILLCLLFAYFLNLPRAFVRHSLVEMSLGIVFFSTTLSISILPAIFKNRKEIFVIVFLFTVVVSNMFKTDLNFDSDNLLNSSIVRFSKNEFKTDIHQKIQRVVIENEDEYRYAVDAIDSILYGDETYLDFTNQTMLYVLAQKEKPVYINQSPALLNGDYSQLKFIEQIERDNDRVKFALLPSRGGFLFQNLDSIPNPYRHYRVAEYIYINFRPLCIFGDYVMWCKKEDFDSISNRDFKYSICDYEYGSLEELHTYNLEQLPYIWAMYDREQNDSLISFETEADLLQYDLDISSISKSDGNYIFLELYSETDGNCSLQFGYRDNLKFKQLNQFNFKLKSGLNRYAVRVSTDFFWYTSKIDSFKIECDTDVETSKIELLKPKV